MQTFSTMDAPTEAAPTGVVGTTRDGALRLFFSRFAWGILLYNIPVILWGAYVRATGSGAGCGSHWPLCNGQVIPPPENVKTLVEFSHRLMSGLDGLLILALLVLALRVYPEAHRVRRAAMASFFFTVTEALIGAVLVKNNLVAGNTSPARAVVMSLHLANTFLLMASLAMTAWWASGGGALRLRGQGAVGAALALALGATLLLGVTGAITALGDTLFPVRSSAEAITQGLNPASHFLLRLRLIHPFFAVSVGLYLILIAGLVSHLRPAPPVRRLARVMGAVFAVEIGVGLLNKLLLAPVGMQLFHLFIADVLWVSLVLFVAAALAVETPQVEFAPALAADAARFHAGTSGATWRDYVLLTKPRVISLLLFTTLAAMFIAAGGWPGTGLFLAVALGGYLSAGAANAINMVIDRDIDGRMERTAKRPTVTQKIPSRSALVFGLGLALVSFTLLWAAANLLSAMLALAGLVFYVVVYTLLLKRRTWHNVVIGGAAGAFPPLVGWAAVTNDLQPLAWYLFAIIFVWTPVHFWALALMIKDDYAKAGVPMLPVVLGERVTVVQITLYAVLTAIVSILPLTLGEVRAVYVVSAVVLNVVLLLRSLQLLHKPGRPRAVSLYKYSMLYLALLFLAMAVDRALPHRGLL